MRLKARFHTDDPYEICRLLKIRVELQPMGTSPGACKGFFLARFRKKVITLNSDLSEMIQRIILIHELGHATLHSSPSFSAFHEFSVLDTTDRTEYEANVFAAEFMLEDNDVLEQLRESNDFFQAAQSLCVPPELLDFKLRLMERRCSGIVAPRIAKADYLKRDLSRPMN